MNQCSSRSYGSHGSDHRDPPHSRWRWLCPTGRIHNSLFQKRDNLNAKVPSQSPTQVHLGLAGSQWPKRCHNQGTATRGAQKPSKLFHERTSFGMGPSPRGTRPDMWALIPPLPSPVSAQKRPVVMAPCLREAWKKYVWEKKVTEN